MRKGSTQALEARQKMSMAKKGKPNIFWKGKRHSMESKAKMSLAHMSKVISEETRTKMSITRKGRKLSEYHRNRISEGRKGMKFSEEHSRNNALARIGMKQSEETRRRKSKSTRGEKSAKWRGGLTAIQYTIRHSLEYKLWREAVFERDEWTCVLCGAHNGQGKTVILNADHIKPFALYPDLRFEISNGRTLCVPCHRNTDTYGGKIRATSTPGLQVTPIRMDEETKDVVEETDAVETAEEESSAEPAS